MVCLHSSNQFVILLVVGATCQRDWIWDYLDVSGCAFKGISRVLTDEERPTLIVTGTIHGLCSQTEQKWKEEEVLPFLLFLGWYNHPHPPLCTFLWIVRQIHPSSSCLL